MMIGCLGDVPFTVSSRAVQTIDNMKWSGSARYAVHQRHGIRALPEFTGIDLEQISFDFLLLASLGADPMDEIERIQNYERKGRPVPFILGDKVYGRYRWTVVSHEIKAQAFDARGNLMSVTVSVKLQEYVRR